MKTPTLIYSQFLKKSQCRIVYMAMKNADPDNHVIATYKVKSKLPILKAAGRIVEEQGTGTWIKVGTTTSRIDELYSPKILKARGRIAVLAFPMDDFSIKRGGIPQVLSIIAGNLFGLEQLEGVRLEDVTFPKEFVKEFEGPRFGMEGVRKFVGTDKTLRPHVGTIVKPKIGLPPSKTASVAFEAFIGGCDLVKDDETLVDQNFCPLEERLTKVMDAVDRVKSQTGRRVLYAVNISSEDILDTAQTALDLGANMLMIDVVTCGFSALHELSTEFGNKVPIHVHRTMHGAITRNPDLGISMEVLAKLVRLCGGDQLHVGTFGVGKMHCVPKEDADSAEAITERMGNLKPAFPVCSGGLYAGDIPELIKRAGKNIVIQAGGGVHGHPNGTRAGAMSLRQAVDAVMAKKSLTEWAKTHEELRVMLEHVKHK